MLLTFRGLSDTQSALKLGADTCPADALVTILVPPGMHPVSIKELIFQIGCVKVVAEKGAW